MQTTLPPFANTMREGLSKVIAQEGYAGYVLFPFPYLISLKRIKADDEVMIVCTKAPAPFGAAKSPTQCANPPRSKNSRQNLLYTRQAQVQLQRSATNWRFLPGWLYYWYGLCCHLSSGRRHGFKAELG